MSTELVSQAKEGFISKKIPQNTSMNFALLRKLGIETIQEYSGSSWTDHNVHDPGITILEVLAYAMTELGIKVNSPIEDILASGEGEFNDLFKPAEVLPSAPVTIIDYRKLLIDQDNIHNAWITKRSGNAEVNIFFDELASELSYTQGDKIRPQGFYDILIEFENTELNTNLLKAGITTTAGNDYIVEVVFPYWDEVDSSHLEGLELQNIDILTVPGTGDGPGNPEQKIQDEGDQNYFAVMELTYNPPFTEDFGVHIKITPEIEEDDREELLNYVDATDQGAVVDLLTDMAEEGLMQQFVIKNNESKTAISDIRSFIHDYRNLCEDFFNFKTVRTQQIGVNADIDITVGSDAESILAEIFFVLGQTISPIIKFRSYEQMVALGYSTEEIFEGPLLQNGFLRSSDLTLGERLDSETGETIIYTSDLFNLIKSLNDGTLSSRDQIIDLRNFSLSNFINNQLVTEQARNCLKLTLSDTFKPKLDILKSNIKLFKEGIKIDYDLVRVIELYDQKVADALSDLKSYSTDVLGIPSGRKLSLGQYTSVQQDFPLHYGIGDSGLPENSTDLRKAQAHQLKAYLGFFDQIYVNFLAQLNNVKELFSFNSDMQSTYFSQLLSDIPLLNDILASTYDMQMANIIEPNNSQTQLERKNKFLSHLAARFGESPDHFLNLFQGDYEIVQHQLIEVKKNLLKKHPELSSNRFKAFNYTALNEDLTPDVWDTHNISGYEKRVCHLLGFNDCTRRHLYNPVMSFFELYQEMDEDAIDEQRFRLINTDSEILLSSPKAYTDDEEMLTVIRQVITYGLNRDRYNIIIGENDKYYFSLTNLDEDIIAHRIEPFDTIEEAEVEIQEIIDFIGFAYVGEGFHLIEHLLLRPTLAEDAETEAYALMPVVFDNDSSNIIRDPYSFQITLVIPSGYERDFSDPEDDLEPLIGMERFRDKDFRRIMERTLRDESPAHALLHIYTIDADTSGQTGDSPSLNNFERVYRQWLETLADTSLTNAAKIEAQAALVSVLSNIYNRPTI